MLGISGPKTVVLWLPKDGGGWYSQLEMGGCDRRGRMLRNCNAVVNLYRYRGKFWWVIKKARVFISENLDRMEARRVY